MAWDKQKAERFGETLKDLRGAKGFTQESLAWHAGTTKNQIQLLESGKASGNQGVDRPSNPRITSLMGLADALDMSLAELMEAADL